MTFADLTFDPASRRALRAGRTIELTARETALLALLMRRPRAVVSRELALAEVWEEGTGSNVVDRYVANGPGWLCGRAGAALRQTANGQAQSYVGTFVTGVAVAAALPGGTAGHG